MPASLANERAGRIPVLANAISARRPIHGQRLSFPLPASDCNFMVFLSANQRTAVPYDLSTGRSSDRLTAQAAQARQRLASVVLCDPTAILGVLEYWLAPRFVESEDA
jgi:hypothetical protein